MSSAAAGLALALLAAGTFGGATVHAGSASATFRVTATVVTGDTGTCRVDAVTGVIQCRERPASGTWHWRQIDTGFRLYGGYLADDSDGSASGYGGFLGATSTTRRVNFGGWEYWETTVSW